MPPKPTILSRLIPLIILVLLALLIIGLGQFITAKKQCLAEEKKQTKLTERPAVNCILLDLSPGPISDRLSLPGVVEPWEDLTLLAKVGGTISKVLVREGEQVHKGQTLALIEEDDYRIAHAGAKAAHRLAQSEYKRNKGLHDKKLLPLASLQASETNLQTALAALDHAALQLERCTITSPLSGIIQHLNAKEGLLLSHADPIARILQIDRVLAVVGIPESDVDAVRRTSEVEVRIKALNITTKGHTHYLASAPQQGARLYRLELALDNPQRAILPGMFLRANIIKEQNHNALTLPLYAIISRNDEQYVFVAEDGRAVKRLVQTGISEGWLVEIVSGLAAGDKVILEGQRQLEDGRAIKIIQTINDASELKI